ncbi:CMT1A duplicated region transcript 4 protein isoform X1 [Sphaerodactylus townsendi]|uniref:CMT1A duplicated region transcript 4 protein isoform X1 n=1 Tax=Sphaerodactylus townsendi TaxID=933632 RepID=UPI002026CB15|nr:CMT1A duplicated region transcript 4 protein isoform X1 [Sphaerodactylus townsendi]
MVTFLKDILEPSQRDIFNQLTQTDRTMAFSINTVKDRALLSCNIGLPSHLVQRCRQWPAYTNYTSLIVKKLAEEDKFRTAKWLPVPQMSSEKQQSPESCEDVILQKKHSDGSQEAEATEPSSAFSHMGTTLKDLPVCPSALVMQTSSLPLGPTATSNLVIFSRRAPFRVLPMKLPDITPSSKTKPYHYKDNTMCISMLRSTLKSLSK